MTETEKAYIAGLVDGEGCIGVRCQKGKYLIPTVEVVNTDKNMLIFLNKFFRGGVYQNKDLRPTRKPTYHWMIAAKKALDFIRLIYPYLRTKRLQADLVLSIKKYDNTRRDTLGRIVRTMTEEDFRENRRIKSEIHRLNRRGAVQKAGTIKGTHK